MQQRHETVGFSMHHVGNILIDWVDDTTALVETYCLAWQALSPEKTDVRSSVVEDESTRCRPIEMVMVARYVDVFTKRGGTWRIQERQVVTESSMRVTADTAGPDMRGFLTGRRDEGDHLVRMRAKLGVTSD